MTSVWTWGGTYFGSLYGDSLWTHDGKHVGKLRGEEIFGQDGQYLGEIKNDNRLITNLPKKSLRGPSFTPHANRVGHVPYGNYVGYVMYTGYEDFPAPDTF